MPALPRFLLIPLTLLVGAIAGGAWTLAPIWLRQRKGVHEVVSTLLMNYVAIYLAEYLVLGSLGDGSAIRVEDLGRPAGSLTSAATFVADQFKGWALGLVLGGAVAACVLWIMATAGSGWWVFLP